MTPEARRELLQALRPRYHASRSRSKKRILKELIAATGYHEKYALRLLNGPAVKEQAGPRHRHRVSLYNEAAKKVLVEVWEVLDRACSKIVKAAMPRTLDALEHHQHLTLDGVVRDRLLEMSASTIDRLLRSIRNADTTKKRRRRAVPEIRRRIPVRTFGDWKDPPPGSMEMDLVAHCGGDNRGSYIHSLVLTDIGSGWTECAPLLVRDSGLVVHALERIYPGLPFVLSGLDVDNGGEFINETLMEFCIKHHIELTRSRPYRKNDQCWIEQKNGDVVRRHVGYERFEGIAVYRTLSRLYETIRLYQNFFQPSFKLAEKHRQGSQVTKRYLPPATPFERLLEAQNVPQSNKDQLRELAASLDPVKLMEDIHALRARLAMTVKGGEPDAPLPQQEPRRTVFSSSVPVAPFVAEVLTAPIVEAPRREVGLAADTAAVAAAPPPTPMRWPTGQAIPKPPAVHVQVLPGVRVLPFKPLPPGRPLAHGLEPAFAEQLQEKRRESARQHVVRRPDAFTLLWPQICRRLEGYPNLSAAELFDEVCVQNPGRFHAGQKACLRRRVVRWRKDARVRGITIGKLTYRSVKPHGRTRPDPFAAHWPEMVQCLQADPDQTPIELLETFMARYPGVYQMKQLRTLQRRVKIWRQDELKRLINVAHEENSIVRPEADGSSGLDRTA